MYLSAPTSSHANYLTSFNTVRRKDGTKWRLNHETSMITYSLNLWDSNEARLLIFPGPGLESRTYRSLLIRLLGSWPV